MEQSAEREDLELIRLKWSWEAVVCGIDQGRGYRVSLEQSWSVYAFLSAVLYSEVDSHYTCQGSKQPCSASAHGHERGEASGISYHHVFHAAVDARGSAASELMGLRLIPIAREVLAAWPEYRYATIETSEQGQHEEKC